MLIPDYKENDIFQIPPCSRMDVIPKDHSSFETNSMFVSTTLTASCWRENQ
jgi:hypothetical protein